MHSTSKYSLFKIPGVDMASRKDAFNKLFPLAIKTQDAQAVQSGKGAILKYWFDFRTGKAVLKDGIRLNFAGNSLNFAYSVIYDFRQASSILKQKLTSSINRSRLLYASVSLWTAYSPVKTMNDLVELEGKSLKELVALPSWGWLQYQDVEKTPAGLTYYMGSKNLVPTIKQFPGISDLTIIIDTFEKLDEFMSSFYNDLYLIDRIDHEGVSTNVEDLAFAEEACSLLDSLSDVTSTDEYNDTIKQLLFLFEGGPDAKHYLYD